MSLDRAHSQGTALSPSRAFVSKAWDLQTKSARPPKTSSGQRVIPIREVVRLQQTTWPHEASIATAALSDASLQSFRTRDFDKGLSGPK